MAEARAAAEAEARAARAEARGAELEAQVAIAAEAAAAAEAVASAAQAEGSGSLDETVLTVLVSYLASRDFPSMLALCATCKSGRAQQWPLRTLVVLGPLMKGDDEGDCGEPRAIGKLSKEGLTFLTDLHTLDHRTHYFTNITTRHLACAIRVALFSPRNGRSPPCSSSCLPLCSAE